MRVFAGRTGHFVVFVLLWLNDSVKLLLTLRPGAVAQLEACPLGMQAALSSAILPLPLIQEQQLSVTGKRMCTKYW